jgi:CubicO group peptidase (beta-lactamase class C family)
VPEGVASYRLVPREELRDPDKAKGWYERAGAQGVVAMRLVKADKRQTWSPSMWNTPYYSSLWGYYGYGWGAVYDPGVKRTETIAVIETLIFSVPQNKLLWAGVTQTTDPKDASRIIKDVVAATVKEMDKQGLIRRPGA